MTAKQRLLGIAHLLAGIGIAVGKQRRLFGIAFLLLGVMITPSALALTFHFAMKPCPAPASCEVDSFWTIIFGITGMVVGPWLILGGIADLLGWER